MALFAGSLFSAELMVDDSHSEVKFEVTHLMISTVTGQFGEYDGDIVFDLDSRNFSKFDATVNPATVNTGIEKRDKHLRSADFFHVEKYPNLTFKMTDYSHKGNIGKMTGDLMIHGVTKKVTLDTKVTGIIKDLQGNTRVGIELRGTINRKDFGLNWNKVLEFGGVAVGDEVRIIVNLETVVIE